MSDQDIAERVRAVIADQFSISPDVISRETTALDVDGWDSVTHVYLMLEIERRFGFKIPDDRVFNMDNVGDLIDLLTELSARR